MQMATIETFNQMKTSNKIMIMLMTWKWELNSGFRVNGWFNCNAKWTIHFWKHCNLEQFGCGSKNCMGNIEDSINLKLEAWVHHCKLFFPWCFYLVNDGNKLNHVMFQSMCEWFATLFSKLIVPRIPPSKQKVWFHITSNMGLFLWRSIFWLNIQSLGVGGKMLI